MKNNPGLTSLFHFLRSLTQENEPCFDDLVSFFKELDTRQGTLLRHTLFHFLRILTQENELCSDDLVSFFKELDTRKRTVLRQNWFHFLRRLTQEKNHAPTRPHHNEQEVIASKSSTPDGRKTSWKSGPNAPST